MRPRPLALALVLLAPLAAAQSAVTVASAVQSALANGTDVRTAQANLEKATAADRAAQADPSTLAAARLSAQNAEALARVQLRAARLSTLQNTVNAYTALLEAQENVDLQTLQVQVDQKALQVAQVKLSVNNATPLDVQRAQNTLSGSTQDLADARAQVNLASGRLATLTGLDNGVRAAGLTSVPTLKTSLASLRTGLNANLTSVVSAGQEVAEAQLAVKLADNDFTPAQTISQARITLANTRRTLDAAQKNARTTLASAYQTAQNAAAQLQVALSREAAAQKSYTQDAARLRGGTISAVTLQGTQLALKQARYARLQAQDNVLEALAALSVAAGQNLTGIGGTL
ncbi:transporter [Deinococcus aetherius]|uniref:Transporter n=1 Tax=Deinococcus aetherius TaxID=200252 RepID=A0ABM8AGC6_9DEIO|nr:TolC family protein [Deinococcus aetherius]BDP42855.1 transporter [Deinococcus aetherius]